MTVRKITTLTLASLWLAMGCGGEGGGDGTTGGDETGSTAGSQTGDDTPTPMTGASTGGTQGAESTEGTTDDTTGDDTTGDDTTGDATTGDTDTTGEPPEDCTGPLVGWATMNGGTTGGQGGPTTMVDNAADLLALAAADGPQIIVVSGEITLGQTLQITSDKTIEGEPGGATLHGSVEIDGDDDDFISNVIVRNLTIDGAPGPDEDAFSIQYATNLWLDHLEIHDGADGNLDITHAADFITISYCVFHYTAAAPDPAHRFSNLIGHSNNNAAEDANALNVTLHHSWWTTGVVERMPRVRFGQIHAFNNLYDSPDTNYAIRAAIGSEVLVEANVFDGLDNPHEIFDPDAELVAIDNIYTSGMMGEQAGDAFVPPYAYVPDAAADVQRIVPACAGPR